MMAWLNEEKEQWIICLQEPHVTSKGVSKLPAAYTAFWSTRNTTTKMTARITNTLILAPKVYKGYMVSQHSDVNCVIVRFESVKFSAVSMYCSIHDNVKVSMRLLVEELGAGRQIIACVDTNAHHLQWGSIIKRKQHTTAFYRGRDIMEILDENELQICNNIPHRPTYVSDMPGKSSHIDATFVSDVLSERIVEWEVREETLDSDHRIITFKLLAYKDREGRVTAQEQTGTPWKNPTKKMEMVMKRALDEKVHMRKRLRDIGDIEEFVKAHTEEIQGVLKAVFRKRYQPRKKNVYWWNNEVEEAYKEMKKARKRKGRYGHENLRVEFEQRRKYFRQIMREAKIKSWENFTSAIINPWSGFMKILTATDNGKSISRTMCDMQGNYACDMKETLISLSNSFYPPPAPVTEYHKNIIRLVEDRLQCIRSTHINITTAEFRMALNGMSKATAPGLDTITNNIIQHLATIGRYEKQYIMLYNECLRNYYFPSTWKKAKVVMIPKAHTLADSVKSLRPISLTSTFGKVLERIVLARILYYLNLSNSISDNQHAYRKGFSTQTALNQVFGIIHEAVDNRQICIAVFLDISGAFDRTWHIGILKKLLDYGVADDLVAFVRNFLTGRTAIFKEGEEELEVSLKQGCPQGGVLSPALWNVLFNDMLNIKSDDGDDVSIVAYADDAVVLCRAGTVAAASKKVTNYLAKIYDWSVKNRVNFNTAKLATMTFSSKQRLPPQSAVYFNNFLIKEVSNYKYLGLIVDKKLKWKDHIDSQISKLKNVVRTLRGAVKEKWGIRMTVLRTLYHAILVPIMTYGITVWGWRAQTQEVQLKFNKVLRQYCLMATRCLRSTSNVMLFRMMNTSDFLTILHNTVRRVSLLQLKVYNDEVIRRREGGEAQFEKRSIKGLQQICNKEVTFVDEVEFNDNNEYYREHPAQRSITNITVRDKNVAIWDSTNISGWCIYTDASASSYGMGWAFAVFHQGFCVARKSAALTKCSVFEAEAYAILRAAEYTESIRSLKRNEYVEIRTDAQSVVVALSNIITTDPILVRVKKVLKKVEEEGIKIKVVWVPGHNDVYGNMYVDRIAKRAVDSKCVHEIKKYARELRRMITSIEKRKEETKWEEYKAVIPKSFFPKLQDVVSFSKNVPSVSVVQLVTGHTRLNNFVYRIYGRVDSPMCKCDEEEESVEHFLFHCPIYDKERISIWPDFKPTFAFITEDWDKLNLYVTSTQRFSSTSFPPMNTSDRNLDNEGEEENEE